MDGMQRSVAKGRHSLIVQGQPVVEWVARVNKHAGFLNAQGIGIERDGVLVGGVVFCDYQKVSVQIHVASDQTRQWVTRKWLHVIFDYAFRQLGVSKIIGIVPAGNTEAVNFDMRVGFVEETRIKDVYPEGDAIVLEMTRGMCRWIDYERFPL